MLSAFTTFESQHPAVITYVLLHAASVSVSGVFHVKCQDTNTRERDGTGMRPNRQTGASIGMCAAFGTSIGKFIISDSLVLLDISTFRRADRLNCFLCHIYTVIHSVVHTCGMNEDVVVGGGRRAKEANTIKRVRNERQQVSQGAGMESIEF